MVSRATPYRDSTSTSKIGHKLIHIAADRSARPSRKCGVPALIQSRHPGLRDQTRTDHATLTLPEWLNSRKTAEVRTSTGAEQPHTGCAPAGYRGRAAPCSLIARRGSGGTRGPPIRIRVLLPYRGSATGMSQKDGCSYCSDQPRRIRVAARSNASTRSVSAVSSDCRRSPS